MREIPWFRRLPTTDPFSTYRRPSAAREAFWNAVDDADGRDLFSRMYDILSGEIQWADDPGMPAPYRVVRGWRDS